MAKDAGVRAARMEKLGAAVADFDPLPFDGEAAARYGTLVTLAIAAGRDPRPRRMDLMIAAIASVQGLPLFTRNADDFKGLDGSLTVVAI
jgi:predicted nucleic acid-binding protein